MTRKDYELIARILQAYAESDKLTRSQLERHSQTLSTMDTAREIRLKSIVDSFANVLGSDNPRFNRETFLKACGL
jgi:hypothetical protein